MGLTLEKLTPDQYRAVYDTVVSMCKTYQSRGRGPEILRALETDLNVSLAQFYKAWGYPDGLQVFVRNCESYDGNIHVMDDMPAPVETGGCRYCYREAIKAREKKKVATEVRGLLGMR